MCVNTQTRVYGPPETNSEAPGAHGILSCSHATGFDAQDRYNTGFIPESRDGHGVIWRRFGQAQVDLFASPESTHCRLWYSLAKAPRYRCTGTQLAKGLAQVCVSPSEPHCTDPVQSQGGQGTDSLGGPVLAQQILVLGPGAPSISPSLAHSSEEGPPLSGKGHDLALAPRSLEPLPMVPGRDQEDFSPSVVNTLFRRSDQLFVCYGGQQKGKAVSKQRLSHWLVDTICTAYQARGLPCPLGNLFTDFWSRSVFIRSDCAGFTSSDLTTRS
ncbi:LL-diaminopimelate aminotransferase [Labeo rohita]|uniref:LL-diaminopimelate aminotransferase n=1 Tax=Labeo rohita TaxID=84645 RepID=A0ABQ8LRK7_LABRO|nr:LL-diaminopimelate aminotransferase [Labeo rohita]